MSQKNEDYPGEDEPLDPNIPEQWHEEPLYISATKLVPGEPLRDMFIERLEEYGFGVEERIIKVEGDEIRYRVLLRPSDVDTEEK